MSPIEIMIIKQRIIECEAAQKVRMIGCPYDLCSTDRKRELRIYMAEIIALKDFMLIGGNLDEAIQSCINKEQYCGAAGLKRVKEWWNTIQSVKK